MSDEAMTPNEALARVLEAMDDDEADPFTLSGYSPDETAHDILEALEGWRLVSVEMERATMDLGAQQELERLRGVVDEWHRKWLGKVASCPVDWRPDDTLEYVDLVCEDLVWRLADPEPSE